MSRRRYRRPRLFPAVLTAVLAGVLIYTVLIRYAHMRGNAAAMLGVLAAGAVLGRGIRLPSVHIRWRRR